MSRTVLRGTFQTYGGIALENRAAYAHVPDDDDTSPEAMYRGCVEYQIEIGMHVPIWNDGEAAFDCEVRLGTAAEPAELTAAEALHTEATSEPYLLYGGEIRLLGLEDASGRPPTDEPGFALPVGRYAVVIYSLVWEEQVPDAEDCDGTTAPPCRLPDFIVTIDPVGVDTRSFRTKLQPFDHLWQID